MKMLIALVLALSLQLVWAQPVNRGGEWSGEWIKSGLDSLDRVYVTRNASEQDASDTLALISYVSGMLAVHRTNNLGAMVLFSGLAPSSQNSVPEANKAVLSAALLFVPLLKIPDELSVQQTAAILRKFLIQNPARWNESAHALITAAFVAEFPFRQ